MEKYIIGVAIILLITIVWHFLHKRKIKRLKESFKKDEIPCKPELVPPPCAVKDCEQRGHGACTGESCWQYTPVEDE